MSKQTVDSQRGRQTGGGKVAGREDRQLGRQVGGWKVRYSGGWWVDGQLGRKVVSKKKDGQEDKVKCN